MAAIKELIREEETGGLAFGDYELPAKTKKDGFSYNGDSYKIKTFAEITKLEKNGSFVYESVPGTAVHDFRVTEDKVRFVVEGTKDAQITLGMASDQEYKVYLDDVYEGKMKTNIGGKLVLSVELEERESVTVLVEKID